MRLETIAISDAPPVRRFDISDLADVVVIAGPNGVGKTRLLTHIMMILRGDQGQPASTIRIRATCEEERGAWQKEILELSAPDDFKLYQQTLHANRRRRNWRSSILQFESNRSIQNVQPLQFTWDVQDPSDEEVSWEYGFLFWKDRWQDTIHSMFRLIEAQKQSIANRAVQLRREGRDEMRLNFADPMEPFKEVFAQLLAPKQLVDPAARRQTLEYSIDGQTYDISTLSSGEREVVNIAFDFLLRRPTDSIVFFDEPELHLHPELSHRLIQVLQTIGARNQFVLSTHSPDVITASLDQSVIFVSPPRTLDGVAANQAIPVSESDETNQALRLLGQSIGIVSLGKKIVLIEGETSSLDKDVYGALTRTRFPELVLVPSGGKHVVESFDLMNNAVLSKSIWGVEFFMLCDRDSMPAGSPEDGSSQHFRVLGKYHLENYFLDPAVLARSFSELEPENSWLRSPEQIRETLRELARPLISYSVALSVAAEQRRLAGNVSLMPKDCHGLSLDAVTEKLAERARSEAERVCNVLDPSVIAAKAQTTHARLSESLDSDTKVWLSEIPGKPLFGGFAGRASLKAARLKALYLGAAGAVEPSPFEPIIDIFRVFNGD